MEEPKGVTCISCLQAAPLLECGSTKTPCCSQRICNQCLSQRALCPVCRSEFVPQMISLDNEILQEIDFESSSNLDLLTDNPPPDSDETSPFHFISPFDTLAGLSLRYNVPAEAIKKANNLFTSNIQERKKLLIPGKGNPNAIAMKNTNDEIFEKRRKVKLFQAKAPCKEAAEALFYLKEHNFDVDLALRMYREDLDWAAKNHPRNLSRAPGFGFA